MKDDRKIAKIARKNNQKIAKKMPQIMTEKWQGNVARIIAHHLRETLKKSRTKKPTKRNIFGILLK